MVPQPGEREPHDASQAQVQNDEEKVSRNLLEVVQDRGVPPNDRGGPPNDRGCEQQDGSVLLIISHVELTTTKQGSI